MPARVVLDQRTMLLWLLLGSLSVFFLTSVIAFAMLAWRANTVDDGGTVSSGGRAASGVTPAAEAGPTNPKPFVDSRVERTMAERRAGMRRLAAGLRETLARYHWVLVGCFLLLVGGDCCLARAQAAVRRERLALFFRWLLAALAIGAVFAIVQAVIMTDMLVQHWTGQKEGRLFGSGLVCFIVGTHFCHVLGGLIALGWVTLQAARGRYDHEYHWGVRAVTLYWRFLDLMWALLFVTFWGVGTYLAWVPTR